LEERVVEEERSVWVEEAWREWEVWEEVAEAWKAGEFEREEEAEE
jgi:hypothetical protein